MHSVRSSPNLCRKNSTPTITPTNDKKMKKSVSADALADMATEYLQTFAFSRASLEALPCIMASVDINRSLDSEEEMKHLGICLATPPDISCDEEIDEEESTTTTVSTLNRARGSRSRKRSGNSNSSR